MFVLGQPRQKRLRTLLVVVTLASIVGGAGLALRDSIRTERERKASAQRSLDAYAHFASYLYATRIYLAARDRTLHNAFVHVNPWFARTPATLPPASAIPAVPDTTEACAYEPDWKIYRFRMDMPSRQIRWAGAIRPRTEALTVIQDSLPLLAETGGVRLWSFGYAFVDAPGRAEAVAEAVAYAPVRDSAGKTIAIYGYRSCYTMYDVWDYAHIHSIASVVPPFLTRDLPPDSINTIRVTDSHGRVLYAAPSRPVPEAAIGADTIAQIGRVVVRVGIRPKIANLLVADGPAHSPLPDSVLALVASIVLSMATLAMLRTEFRLVASREMFLANVSHELRTPLQHILLFAQILRLKRTRSESEHDKAVEVIETETQRLISLANNVLSVVRPRLTRPELVKVDVVALVNATRPLFQQLANARSMQLELDVEQASVCASAPALRQILINLIDNAVKYGPVGQTVRLAVRKDGELVHMWVDDSGPGIPLESRGRVWEPFVRLERAGDDATAGAGIGLTIVRDLVASMKGQAEIGEAAGGGTRVSIYLRTCTDEEGCDA